MPGICGIAQNNFSEPQLVESMANSLKHEDWHLTDMYASTFFGLARVHLGIFNPEPQPIFNEDKSLCIFMDGKIYDYEKEKRELQRRGHRFGTGSDAEFCLHLYEEKGKDFVKRLNGTFVIAIADIKQGSLVILNDRYGLRPIYCAVDSNRLIVASEVKAILQVKPTKRLNDEAVADFFTFGMLLGDETFFEGIEVLPPASILEYREGKVTIEQYWDFEYKASYDISEEEFIEQLIPTFKRAVERRLGGNYRYGVGLSGGLDSRAIIAAMGEAAHQVTALTIGAKDCDESKIARIVAQRSGMNHRIIEINPDELVAYAEDVVYLSDGMDTIGVSFLPPTHEEYREYVDVLFQGLSGDTLLRSHFLDAQLLNAKSDEELIQLLYQKTILFSHDMRLNLFKKDYYTMIKDLPMNSLRGEVQKAKGEPLGNKADYFILQNRMRRLSWMGSGVIARNKVEETNPNYDNDFIELIQKVPPRIRLGDHIFRKFLKRLSPELARIRYYRTGLRADAPSALWPAAVAYTWTKPKLKKLLWSLSGGRLFIPNTHPYVDLEEYLLVNKKWQKLVRDTLLDEGAMIREYFNMDYVRRLIEEHGKILPPQNWLKRQSFTTDYSQQLSYLASFEIFLRLLVK